jgi:hypothetical protein
MPLDVSGERVRLTDRPDFIRQLFPARPLGAGDRDRLARVVESATTIDAFVEGFVSPFRPDRSVVALVPSGSDGRAAMAALFMPAAPRGPVYGALAVAHGVQFQSFLVDHSTYHAGDFNTSQRTAVFVVEHYWLIPVLAVLLALAMGSRVRQITERVAARRLRARSRRKASRFFSAKPGRSRREDGWIWPRRIGIRCCSSIPTRPKRSADSRATPG